MAQPLEVIQFKRALFKGRMRVLEDRGFSRASARNIARRFVRSNWKPLWDELAKAHTGTAPVSEAGSPEGDTGGGTPLPAEETIG